MKVKNIVVGGCISVLLACGEQTTQPPGQQTASEHATVEQNEPLVSESDSLVMLVPAPVKTLIDQNKVFDEFEGKFLRRYWELFPSRAVASGYYLHDDQLEVENGDLRVLRRAFFVSELQALKTFDATQLSLSNATDLTILENQFRAQLWYIDRFRRYEWDPSVYNVASTFGIILNTDYKPLSERLMTVLKRLDNVPAYYQAAKNNIKVPTLEHLDLAIEQSQGALAVFESMIPSKLKAAKMSAEQQALFEPKLANAIGAIKGYIVWMKGLQANLSEAIDPTVEADGDESLRARDFRIGAELYERKFAYDIVSGYSARELYDVAIKAKESLHREMATIAKDLWDKYFPDQELPSDDLVAIKTMIDHLSAKHIERDQFVDEIRRQIPIIQKFMDDNELLDSDPSRPLVVRLTPEYQRGFAGASVNAPGPYDATANTYYNVSPLDDYTDEQAESYLREYNHWILQILNIHEAIPGHYTQLMHANKSPSKIKSIFGNGAMVEGWAVYSERMMLEAGYGNNEPEMWLMYSKWNLRVVVNTILDYSVQVLGMKREQALDMLINEAFQERTEAENKWRRATVSQVQLTSYFSGYSEIYAFRNELKQKMGETFDLRMFHNQFLSYGNAPVPVIRDLMLQKLNLAN